MCVYLRVGGCLCVYLRVSVYPCVCRSVFVPVSARECVTICGCAAADTVPGHINAVVVWWRHRVLSQWRVGTNARHRRLLLHRHTRRPVWPKRVSGRPLLPGRGVVAVWARTVRQRQRTDRLPRPLPRRLVLQRRHGDASSLWLTVGVLSRRRVTADGGAAWVLLHEPCRGTGCRDGHDCAGAVSARLLLRQRLRVRVSRWHCAAGCPGVGSHGLRPVLCGILLW